MLPVKLPNSPNGLPSDQSTILSAASSICLFASYSLFVSCSVSKVDTTHTALLVLPVSDSFAANVPVLLITCSILVELSHDLTSAVVEVVPPVTAVSYTHLRAHETG